MLVATPSRAQDPSQSAFTVDQVAGEVRNHVTLSIEANRDVMDTAAITVHDDGGTEVLSGHYPTGAEDKQLFKIAWNTRDVADGGYTIEYSATDRSGAVEKETKHVTVMNSVPLLTLSKVAQGRMIGGGVSREDVTLRLEANGANIAITPDIATSVGEDGFYIWRVELPQDITYGKEYAFKAVATVQSTGADSSPAEMVMTLHAAPPVVAPVTPAPPPTATPVLNLALEIGRFIAPVLPKAPETQLFGVPTTDLTQETTDKSVTPVPAATRTTVPATQAISETQPTPPLKPSDSGWMFFGVAWYWIVMIAVIVSAIVFALARVVYLRDVNQTFVRAESVQ